MELYIPYIVGGSISSLIGGISYYWYNDNSSEQNNDEIKCEKNENTNNIVEYCFKYNVYTDLVNDPNSHFLTSINAVAGIAWEGFRFGYSYSFNTSKIGRDGGVYELSISWQGGDGSNCFGCPRYAK